MMKSIVITGVSTGIGYAATAVSIQRGYHVFGSVRKEADAVRLQAEMGAQFTPLVFDVTDKVGVQTAVSQVRATLGEQNLTALINNAGIVTPGPLMHMSSDSFRRQFAVNLFGLFDVTQAFLPLLGARKDNSGLPGRIINISSVSGKIAYPFMGAYAASKHALEAMSDSLRRELMLYGIDVILIQPGTTRTAITGKFASQLGQYAKTGYGELTAVLEKQLIEREESGLPVEKVVTAVIHALESPRPKTRYAVPRKWLTGWFLPRWLPDRILDKLIAKRLGITRHSH